MESHDSLAQIYEDYAPALFRFLIRLTGDESETRDILQEIFIRLAKTSRPLHGVGAPLSFLFRLAHRLFLTRSRQDYIRRTHDDRLFRDQPPVTLPDPGPGDEALLRQALTQLSPEQRAVLALKIWEDLTFAEVLEISANTAASRYRYALDNLRAHLHPLQRDLP